MDQNQCQQSKHSQSNRLTSQKGLVFHTVAIAVELDSLRVHIGIEYRIARSGLDIDTAENIEKQTSSIRADHEFTTVCAVRTKPLDCTLQLHCGVCFYCVFCFASLGPSQIAACQCGNPPVFVDEVIISRLGNRHCCCRASAWQASCLLFLLLLLILISWWVGGLGAV